MAYPIPHLDYNSMVASRIESFKVATTNEAPLFIDTTILLEDFINYYYQNKRLIFDGIRFYPGFTNDMNLVSIISVSTITGPDDAYCKLTEIDYTQNGDTFIHPISRADAAALLENYRTNILIDGEVQQQNTFVRSRFFYWNNFISFFEANIRGFNETRPDTFSGYSLKIKIAYTSEILSGKFYNEYGIGENATEQIGYTIAISMIDREGNLLIDPNLSFDPDRFENRYLEVAHKCPVHCGSI